MYELFDNLNDLMSSRKTLLDDDTVNDHSYILCFNEEGPAVREKISAGQFNQIITCAVEYISFKKEYLYRNESITTPNKVIDNPFYQAEEKRPKQKL